MLSKWRQKSYLRFHWNCVKSVQIRSYFWSVFSCIRTEYGNLRSKLVYSVRIQENTNQKKLRIWTLFTQCPYFLIRSLRSDLHKSFFQCLSLSIWFLLFFDFWYFINLLFQKICYFMSYFIFYFMLFHFVIKLIILKSNWFILKYLNYNHFCFL